MLFDRHTTVGRASVAWQENRLHITGLHDDLTGTNRLDPHRHKPTQTGNTPLEVSLYERGVALSRAHFSQADPGEREWIEEM